MCHTVRMDDNLTKDILEIERQIQAMTYNAKHHETEVLRLHEQVKRAITAVQKESRDIAPKERELHQLEQRISQLQAEIARKKALVEKEERDLHALESREMKAQKDTDVLKKTATNLKQQVDAKKRSAWRLSQLKKGE